MVVASNQPVILFGTGEKLQEALQDASALYVVGVCQDSLLDDVEIPAGITKLHFEKLKDRTDAVVVVVDDEISQGNAEYFAQQGITYCLRKDLQVQAVAAQSAVTLPEEAQPAVPSEPVQEEAQAETVEELPVVEEVQEESAWEAPVTSSVDEMPTSFAPADPEEEEEPVQQVLSEETAQAILAKLDVLSEGLLTAVKNTKSKDTAVYNMNKELQKYKDGYFAQVSAPLVTDLISLREDCKKSIEDVEKFHPNASKQKVNLEFTVEQIEDNLTAHGVTEKDGVYYWNGSAFYPVPQEIAFTEGATAQAPEVASVEVGSIPCVDATLEGISDRLDALENLVQTCLANDESLVQTVTLQFNENKRFQKICDGLLLKPILISLIQLAKYLKERTAAIGDDDAQATEIYVGAYRYGADYLETLLLKLGVFVWSNPDDTFDPKHHRMLKMIKITQEEAEKDKTVAQYCTDCYCNESKVIYPAKVILYRL